VKNWEGLQTDQERQLLNVLTGGQNYESRSPSNRPQDLEKALQQALTEHKGPITTSINKGEGGHAVTVTEVKNGQVTYLDPQNPKSPTTVPIAEFSKLVNQYSDDAPAPELAIIGRAKVVPPPRPQPKVANRM